MSNTKDQSYLQHNTLQRPRKGRQAIHVAAQPTRPVNLVRTERPAFQQRRHRHRRPRTWGRSACRRCNRSSPRTIDNGIGSEFPRAVPAHTENKTKNNDHRAFRNERMKTSHRNKGEEAFYFKRVSCTAIQASKELAQKG